MSCGSICSSGGVPAGCGNNGSCGISSDCGKLKVIDWLGNMTLPDGHIPFHGIEIRFKNSRKEYFKNTIQDALHVGDYVVVEATHGFDVGTVTMTGELVRIQMEHKLNTTDTTALKSILRKAKSNDIQRWKEAQDLEHETMHRARTMAIALGLNMKLSDVEYQADKSKAIFYYTAEARVDFRALIKVMAEAFKVRIEMKQIGLRHEASRLGGIGSCGRELCCSTWLTDFRTVATSAARYQQLSLNPQKLAGQCGKLKCCLNFELDSYVDAIKAFPDLDSKKLSTQRGDAVLQKLDLFKQIMWFSYRDEPDVLIPMRVDQVKSHINLCKSGNIPPALTPEKSPSKIQISKVDYEFKNTSGEESLNRFDSKRQAKPKKSGTAKPIKRKPPQNDKRHSNSKS
jgi:cell fate regulator YaaT (PSP1 superfamily)